MSLASLAAEGLACGIVSSLGLQQREIHCELVF